MPHCRCIPGMSSRSVLPMPVYFRVGNDRAEPPAARCILSEAGRTALPAWSGRSPAASCCLLIPGGRRKAMMAGGASLQ